MTRDLPCVFLAGPIAVPNKTAVLLRREKLEWVTRTLASAQLLGLASMWMEEGSGSTVVWLPGERDSMDCILCREELGADTGAEVPEVGPTWGH